MIVCERSYQHVEHYFADVPEIATKVLQLTPGALNFQSTHVDLSGVVLEWNRTGAGFRSREVNCGQELMLGFILDSPTYVKLGGQSLSYGSVVLWPPGYEVDYITSPGVASLIILVDKALLELLGWAPSDSIVHVVPGKRLATLANTCRLATLEARSQDAKSAPLTTITMWRERVLAALEPVLEPWLGPVVQDRGTLRTRRWLVKDADRWLEQQDLSRSISVGACAAALGVPRRTLFRAFREELDMGPRHYLQLIRLHRLRERLLAASPAEASITRLAGELGFTHMGRLSAAFFQHFGEYPNATLQRR